MLLVADAVEVVSVAVDVADVVEAAHLRPSVDSAAAAEDAAGLKIPAVVVVGPGAVADEAVLDVV